MALYVGESFDYTAGQTLNAKNGGTGWSNAWATTGASSGNGFIDIYNGTMAYTGVTTAGLCGRMYMASGSPTTTPTASRDFTEIPWAANTTFWIAFTLSSGNSKSASTLKIPGITTDSAGTTNATLLSFPGSEAPSNPAFNAVTLYTGQTAEAFTTHLIVYKLTTGATSTSTITIICYVDPVLANDPSTWTAKTTSTNLYMPNGMSGFRHSSSGTSTTGTAVVYYRIDSFRIASTTQEVFGGSAPSTTANFFPLFMSKNAY